MIRRLLCRLFGHREVLRHTRSDVVVTRDSSVESGRRATLVVTERVECGRGGCAWGAQRVLRRPLWPPAIRPLTLDGLRAPCPRRESDGP